MSSDEGKYIKDEKRNLLRAFVSSGSVITKGGGI